MLLLMKLFKASQPTLCFWGEHDWFEAESMTTCSLTRLKQFYKVRRCKCCSVWKKADYPHRVEEPLHD